MLFLLFLILFFAANSYISSISNNNSNSKKEIFANIVYPASYVGSLAPSPLRTEEKMGFCLRVPVLLYHHIEPYEKAKEAGHAQLTVDSGWFEKQMQYLSENGYTTLFAQELVNALLSHQDIPGKAVVITIDDGYLDNYQYAYSIAKKYNVKLNLMISTGLVENTGYLSWGQIKEMEGSGYVGIYNHTWSHYSLGNATFDKAKQEIETADRQLLQNLDKKATIFTYPYGAFSQNAVDVLKQNGYKAAFTTTPSFWQCDGFIYRLKRNHVGNAPLSSYGL